MYQALLIVLETWKDWLAMVSWGVFSEFEICCFHSNIFLVFWKLLTEYRICIIATPSSPHSNVYSFPTVLHLKLLIAFLLIFIITNIYSHTYTYIYMHIYANTTYWLLLIFICFYGWPLGMELPNWKLIPGKEWFSLFLPSLFTYRSLSME